MNKAVIMRRLKSLHKDNKAENWEQLCFYDEIDFKLMFTEEQTKELLEYHKDQVLFRY